MFCNKRSFTRLCSVEVASQELWNSLWVEKNSFNETHHDRNMFFRTVSNNPGLRQQRDKIWQHYRQLVARASIKESVF